MKGGKVVKLFRFFRLHAFDRTIKAQNIEDALRIFAAERAPLARFAELVRTSKGYDCKFYDSKKLCQFCACFCSTRGEIGPLRISFY